MKKLHKKSYFCGLATIVIILSLSLSAYALSTTREATLYYSGIQLTINGELVTPKDANGATVEPFIIDGTTYLPVRAIGEALGMEVSWDGDTQTVSLDDVAIVNANTYSRSNPAPVGTAQTINIESYSGDYSTTITVTEVIRGADAWTMIQEANRYNSEPTSGTEYIVVKVKADLISAENDRSVSFSEYSFDCFNAQGTEYQNVSVVDPSPEFSGSIYAGGSMEGYIVVSVDETDTAPRIVYGANYDGTGGIWFSLAN